MSVHIFWSDDDGAYVESFANRGFAEERIGELLNRKDEEEDSDYGVTIHQVVEGKTLIMRQKLVKKIKITLEAGI